MRRQFRVKELAEQRGMTQEDLYQAVQTHGSVSMATTQRIWQNHKRLGDQRISTLSAIARALGVAIEDLYTEQKESYNPENTRKPSQVAA